MIISCSEFIQYQRLMPYKKMTYIFLFYKALFLSMMEIFPVILSLFQVTCGFNRGVDMSCSNLSNTNLKDKYQHIWMTN